MPVLDPANLKSTLRCQIPEETFQMLHFAGSSYGQLICGRGRNCLIVDVFTGAEVLPPQLPFGDNTYFYSWHADNSPCITKLTPPSLRTCRTGQTVFPA